MQHMDFSEMLSTFVRDEDGQDVVEYGLLIATIAIVILIATATFGTQIRDWFQGLSGRITTTRRVSSISGTDRVIEKQPLSAGNTPYLRKPMSPAPGTGC